MIYGLDKWEYSPIVPVTLLRGHVSPNTAYVQDDYPDGRYYRVKRRVWIETAVKGKYKGQQRWQYQTTDPRSSTEVWRKPHGGQYTGMVYMYESTVTEDHLAFFSAGQYGLGSPATYAKVLMLGILEQLDPVHAQTFRELSSPEVRARFPHHAEEWDRWNREIAALKAHVDAGHPFPKLTEDGVLLPSDPGSNYLQTGVMVSLPSEYTVRRSWVELHGGQAL